MFSSLLKNRFFAVCFFVLALIVVLSFVHTVSGPRLVSTQTSGTLATTQMNLFFNSVLDQQQTLEVTVQPYAKVTYTINSNKITINFEDSLDYKTNYQVDIAKVESTTKRSSRISTTLTTPRATISYLKRDAAGNDTIFLKSYDIDAQPKAYFEASRIGDFAFAGLEHLLVVREIPEKPLESELVYTKNGRDRVSIIPPQGYAVAVVGSSTQPHFLVRTQQKSDLTNRLYLYDAVNDTFEEVTRDNSSIHATDMSFGSDGRTIIYRHATDGVVYMLDPENKRPASSFGSIYSMKRALPDDSGLFFETEPSVFVFVSNKGERQTVAENSTLSSPLLLTNGALIAIRNNFSLSTQSQEVVKFKNGESMIFYANEKNLNLRKIHLSSNDEFISIQSSATPAIFDGYRIRPEPKDSTTTIYSRDGRAVDTINGTHLTWL